MRPGGACTACPGFFSVPPQPPTGHAGTMDRAQEPQPRDSGAQVDTAATEGAQSHATGQGYRDTGKPRNRPQSRPQRRTEPPTEGKPPGVQKRRGGQAHSHHSPGTAPRAKIRAVFCDFSSDFLPFFSALSRSACEFYSRKVESRELIVESRSAMEVGAGLIVGKSVNRSVPRLHPPKVAWSGRRRCTSAGFHRLNSRCPVERSE